MKDGPPPGKEHRKPENYYKDVLKGACLVADECSKDVFFEYNSLVLSCALKTCSYALSNAIGI